MVTETHLDTEQLVADLALEFCERARCGDEVPMEKYLDKCPDSESREHFKELVNTDLVLRAAVGAQRKSRTT